MATYKCSRCRKLLPEDEFPIGIKGLRLKYCKDCESDIKEYNEKKKEESKTWRLSDEWKPHPTYPNYAANGETGLIANTKTRRIVGTIRMSGYIYITVKQHPTVSMEAHRLMWECHNGIIPEDRVINHINEVKHDNRLVNLELVTQSENLSKSTHKIHGRRQSKQICGHILDSEETHVFISISEAARQTGCIPPTIGMCVDGQRDKTTSKTTGSVWCFAPAP